MRQVANMELLLALKVVVRDDRLAEQLLVPASLRLVAAWFMEQLSSRASGSASG